MSERQIQTDILLYLGTREDLASWRSNTGAARWSSRTGPGGLVRFGIPGQSDITCIRKPSGQFIAIEVKTKTGRQSKDQKRFQEMIEKYGGKYILARSVADVEGAL